MKNVMFMIAEDGYSILEYGDTARVISSLLSSYIRDSRWDLALKMMQSDVDLPKFLEEFHKELDMWISSNSRLKELIPTIPSEFAIEFTPFTPLSESFVTGICTPGSEIYKKLSNAHLDEDGLDEQKARELAEMLHSIRNLEVKEIVEHSFKELTTIKFLDNFHDKFNSVHIS